MMKILFALLVAAFFAADVGAGCRGCGGGRGFLRGGQRGGRFLDRLRHRDGPLMQRLHDWSKPVGRNADKGDDKACPDCKPGAPAVPAPKSKTGTLIEIFDEQGNLMFYRFIPSDPADGTVELDRLEIKGEPELLKPPRRVAY